MQFNRLKEYVCPSSPTKLTQSFFLSSLPDEIVNLNKLKHWNGGGNLFTHLDNLNLGSMEAMEELLFAECQLDHFPKGLGRMTNLRVLDLTANQLTVLPREVGWLDKSMRKLLAGNNRLPGIPGELSFLNPAIELDLGNNPFKVFIHFYHFITSLFLKPFFVYVASLYSMVSRRHRYAHGKLETIFKR